LHRNIVNEHGKPIYTINTWEKKVGEIKSGKYDLKEAEAVREKRESAIHSFSCSDQQLTPVCA